MSSEAKSPSPEARSGLTVAKAMEVKETLRVRDYGKVLLRPIKPEDEPLLVKFHSALSEDSVHSRYFEMMALQHRVEHERLQRICANNDDSFALVAERSGRTPSSRAILGIGRLSRTDDPAAVDFAILVIDQAQGHGIGSALIKQLIDLARVCGFKQLVGEVLVANHDMINVCRHFGFSVLRQEDGVAEVSLRIH